MELTLINRRLLDHEQTTNNNSPAFLGQAQQIATKVALRFKTRGDLC